MIVLPSGSFATVMTAARDRFLITAREVDVGRWQSIDVSDRPEMVTHELLNVSFEIRLPASMEQLQHVVRPNLPWAEDHFQERVSGEPWNPPPSQAWWPFAQQDNAEFKKDEKFSHTYPERYWPKMANVGSTTDKGRQIFVPHVGVRFEYGDLGDVVHQLAQEPLTRQAYLPVWFPEDTGAVHGERVPCSLGYHFIIRENKLNCVYYIRSCDFMRHFRDDVYMTWRLVQWLRDELDMDRLTLGTLTMHITSFHIFAGDVPILEGQSDEA